MNLKTYCALSTAFFVILFVAACAPPPAAQSTVTAAPTSMLATPTAAMGCTSISAPPTPSGSSLLPPVTAADYVRGPANASVTLLFYCDFQSAQCEIFNRVLDELEKNHPNDLKVVLRPFPIAASVMPALDKSELSARAAIAAGNQGKFWEMHDLLHAQYSSWIQLSPAQFQDWVANQVVSLQLDGQQFKQDLSGAATQSQTKSMYDSALAIGISSIPTVFVNGTLQQRPALSYEGLESTISLIALGSKQFKSCPSYNIDTSKQYIATLHTEKGNIVVQLYADKAPLAVNSFVYLARQGWFNGVTFHRVVPGFVAQAGDPSGTGRGGPGYYFDNEVRADLLFNKPGVVGIANAGPDTNGSQFFITFAPEPRLDGSYTIFGQVTQGMDVVESLTPRDPQQSSVLTPGDKILTVTIQEK